MDKKQIRKEIAVLINSIKEHSDNIGDKEHIPQLELELILHKIEKLYQKSIVFNHLNSIPRQFIQNPVEKKAEKEIVKEIPVEEDPKIEVFEKKEIPKTETPKAPVDLFGAELTPATEKPKAEKKTEKKEERSPVIKIQKPAISDLKSAIGINDKFQFANELFGGNILEYEIAVQQLNTAETIESASEYFMSIQQLYNWDSENETVKRLFDLVERRYS
jgi:hypothetical protein